MFLGVGGSTTFLNKLAAGAFAGCFGAVTGNPLVILRTRMIVNKGVKKNLFEFAKDIYSAEGIKGFYKGY